MTELRNINDRTIEFATRVVKLCHLLGVSSGVSRTLAKQLLRSGTSVGANVEEAHGSHSKLNQEKYRKTHPKHGFPPDLQEEAVKTVLMQAEILCAEWVQVGLLRM